ncbi:MAG: hypothetical protein ABI533_04995, partial [Betaproteobacteria bacterium]
MRAPLRFEPTTSRLARRALWIVASVVFAAVALSCSTVRPATRGAVVRSLDPDDAPRGVLSARPYVAPPMVQDAQADVVVTPVLPPDASALPPESAAPAAAASASPDDADALPPPATSTQIALILPLGVPAYERASAAVRDG